MKRLALILALFAGLTPASAFWQSRDSNYNIAAGGGGCSNCMVTHLFVAAGNGTVGPSNASTSYFGMNGTSAGLGWTTTQINREFPSPVAGTFSNLEVVFNTTLSQGSWVVSFNDVTSGSNTLTCTIDTTHATCGDTNAGHNITVAVGDIIDFSANPNGTTPTAQTNPVQLGIVFTSTVGNESPLYSSTTSGTTNNATPEYTGFGYLSTGWNATEVNVSSIVAAPGTIDQLNVYAPTAAPGAGKTFTYTLYKNGSPTSLKCPMTGTGAGNQVCVDSNVGDAVTVAAGDTISLQAAPTGTPTITVAQAGDARWVPSTPGQSLVMEVSVAAPTVVAATRFMNFAGTYSTAASTEISNYNISPVAAFTVKNLYTAQDVTPGGSTTRQNDAKRKRRQ